MRELAPGIAGLDDLNEFLYRRLQVFIVITDMTGIHAAESSRYFGQLYDLVG